MTCGLTDKNMTVNSTAKENDAPLCDFIPQSSWEAPNPTIHTRQLGCYPPTQSSKTRLPNFSCKYKLQVSIKGFKSGYNKHCNLPN